MKKVVILSQADFAGVGYQACKAINSVGKFNVRAITMQCPCFGFPVDIVIPCHQPLYPGKFAKDCENYNLVNDLLKNADIIHVWDDIPEDPKYMDFEKAGIEIPKNKPIIVTMTGSLYRNEHKRLNAIIKERGWKLIIQNPMLRFLNEIESTFIPHTIDTEFLKPIENKKNEKITLGVYFGYAHPTTRKDRLFFEDHIKGKIISVIDYSHSISWVDYIKIIQKCDIFYHGIVTSREVGYVGKSSLEAMTMGIPVIMFVNDKKCIELAEGKIGTHIPVYNANEETFSTRLEELINDKSLREELGKRGREWVERYFSYKVVGQMYSKIYEEVLGK